MSQEPVINVLLIKLQTNVDSGNHKLSGLAMTAKTFATFTDFFNNLRIQADINILQFLWKDLTSLYDIVVPYFTSSDLVDGQFILTCVLEAVKLFLKTSLLVCLIENTDYSTFWKVESPGINTTQKDSDAKFLKSYLNTKVINQLDGSYALKFPWKRDHPPLPC